MKNVPPPIPNPSKPEFMLPRGACDTHCHVNGPASVFPYSNERRYTPPDAPAEQLEALHRMLGVERVVFVQATIHGYDNSAMLDAVARSPRQNRGVALLHAGVSAEELTRLHKAGVRGVRFNFVRHLGGPPDLAAVSQVAERIQQLGWHLVLHLDAEDLIQYRPFLDTLPIPFVIDHMGRTMVENGIDQAPLAMLLDMLKDERAWVKISGPERISASLSSGEFPYADTVPFARRLMAAAPERILWGTDWPHPNVREMPDDGKLVDLLPHYTDDESLLHKLLVDNPTRLYWYD
jgi:predicted TIM-barrel fold metal-dependent hydrolase